MRVKILNKGNKLFAICRATKKIVAIFFQNCVFLKKFE